MIIIPAIVEALATRKDKTYRLTIGTNELTPEVATRIFGLNQKFVYVAIKENEFQNEEQEHLKALKTDLEDSQKTPAQRLHATLYVLWTQKNEGFTEFRDFYKHKMEKVNNHFKGKLQP